MSKKNKKRQGLTMRPMETRNQGDQGQDALNNRKLRLTGAVKAAQPQDPVNDGGFDKTIFEFEEIIDDTDGGNIEDSADEMERAICAAAGEVQNILFEGGCQHSHALLHDVLRAACLALSEGEAELLSGYVDAFVQEIVSASQETNSMRRDEQWDMKTRDEGDDEPDELDRLIQEMVMEIAALMPGDSVEYNQLFLHQAVRCASLAAITEDHDAFARHIVNYIAEAKWNGGVTVS